VLLPPLKPKNNIFQQTGHYAVSITNNQNLSHLQMFQGTSTEPTWDHYLGYSVTALATSSSIVAVCLEDWSVHTFYTAKGARATPPFAPPSPIARLHAAGSMVSTYERTFFYLFIGHGLPALFSRK
jgi:protein HIRA/HIR1